jgi:hypothetical protein
MSIHGIRTTAEIYKVGGEYDTKRLALHDKICNNFTDCHHGVIGNVDPFLITLSGGQAAGKDTFLNLLRNQDVI